MEECCPTTNGVCTPCARRRDWGNRTWSPSVVMTAYTILDSQLQDSQALRAGLAQVRDRLQ